MTKRLNIGLLTTHLDDEFANLVSKGAIMAAKEIDANLIIMPGRYIDAHYFDTKRTYFDFQYNTLFSYASSESLDGIVVLLGSIGNVLDQKRKKTFIDKFKGKPVVTLTVPVDGYSSVTFENKAGLCDGINHLIREHGKTKIGFVGGARSNNDAIERLNAYKEALAENNIPYDSELVVYGDFSPYCHKAVEDLLDRNPDIEAIAFANDQMAAGGYEVLKKRNLRIGSDILVIGFDNIPSASTMNPPLTSVKADAAELGYASVLECRNIITSGQVVNSKVSSSLIKRDSCGCCINSSNFVNSMNANGSSCDTAENTAHSVCQYMFESYKGSLKDPVHKKMYDFIVYLFNFIHKLNDYDNTFCNSSDALKSVSEISDLFTEVLFYDFFRQADIDKMFAVFDYMKFLCETVDSFSACQKSFINNIFFSLNKITTNQVIPYSKKKLDDVKLMAENANLIIQSMVSFDGYHDDSYAEVVDKFALLNIKSSYIYAFDQPIRHSADKHWATPKYINLKAYHNNNEIFNMPRDDQFISIDKLFSHRYLPDDRNCVMVISPLFSRFEHYGLLICELEQDYFYYMASLSAQLCAAMRISSLIKNQDMIKTQLEITLNQIKENNIRLDVISKSDELTGIYNRRGFFDMATTEVNNSSNSGKKAIIVFADLDSLKLINDLFGHDDGDFAIVGAAEILKDSFRSSDIVGRIGGDEFAVFAISEIPNCNNYIRERMNRISHEYNCSHSKPYMVHMSIGIYEFECSADININDIIIKADSLLYEEKKHKKTVLRDKQEFM